MTTFSGLNAFLFDRECLTEVRLRELTAKSTGLLRTTDRRTFENYILHPKAIASVINKADHSRETPITPEEINARLENLSQEGKYLCKDLPQKLDPALFTNAPGILKDLFNQVTECRVSFEKTNHSVATTEWILEHDSAHLEPLASILRECMAKKSSGPADTKQSF